MTTAPPPTMKLPRYLRGKKVPRAVRAAVTCALCRGPLVPSSAEYVACSRKLHGPLKRLDELAQAVRRAWPLLGKRKLLDATVIRRAALAAAEAETP